MNLFPYSYFFLLPNHNKFPTSIIIERVHAIFLFKLYKVNINPVIIGSETILTNCMADVTLANLSSETYSNIAAVLFGPVLILT